MKKLIFFFLFFASFNLSAQKYYEMRTYACFPDKRPDLIERFRNHTLRLFEKHGIGNVAYFIPADASQNSLTFILEYPSKESRDKLWNEFVNDPEWKAAAAKSEENGKLVAKVDQIFMQIVPELTKSINYGKNSSVSDLGGGPGNDKVFELRIYTCLPDRLEALKARFRDHTRALFEKHGMENIVYWESFENEGTQSRLVYFLAHKSEDAAKASFDSFRIDPEWIKARDKSEADGAIVDNIQSIFFKPLPFSPMK